MSPTFKDQMIMMYRMIECLKSKTGSLFSTLKAKDLDLSGS